MKQTSARSEEQLIKGLVLAGFNGRTKTLTGMKDWQPVFAAVLSGEFYLTREPYNFDLLYSCLDRY